SGQRRAVHDRGERVPAYPAPDRPPDIVVPQRFAGEPRGEYRVVGLGDRLDDGLGGKGQRPYPHLLVPRTGDLGQHDQVRGEPVPRLRQDPGHVRPGPVDLVEEQHGRYPDPAQRPPDHDGLRLDPFDAGHHEDGRVEHRQGPLDLGDEVGVARGVEQVDGQVVDREGGERRPDGAAERARVVVVGGGIIGTSVAYHLAHLGCEVLLLERDRLTSGTTWHAAGLMVTFGSLSETSTSMRRYSRDLYARLEAETGLATGLRKVGFIELATDPGRLEEYRRVAAFNRVCGVDVHEIGPGEVKELFPLARVG